MLAISPTVRSPSEGFRVKLSKRPQDTRKRACQADRANTTPVIDGRVGQAGMLGRVVAWVRVPSFDERLTHGQT